MLKKFVEEINKQIDGIQSYPDKRQLEQLANLLKGLNQANGIRVENCLKALKRTSSS